MKHKLKKTITMFPVPGLYATYQQDGKRFISGPVMLHIFEDEESEKYGFNAEYLEIDQETGSLDNVKDTLNFVGFHRKENWIPLDEK